MEESLKDVSGKPLSYSIGRLERKVEKITNPPIITNSTKPKFKSRIYDIGYKLKEVLKTIYANLKK